jgi:hypothetical protein
MEKEREQMLTYLKTIMQLRQMNPKPAGFVYRGAEDFILQNGKFYVPKSADEYRGAPKSCFGNALIATTINRNWTYVEGFAMSDIGIPVHHGWIADPYGSAIEVTWEKLGTVYFGVAFAAARALEALWDNDASILENYKDGFALYREHWNGEDFTRWPCIRLADVVARAEREDAFDRIKRRRLRSR